MLDFFTISTRTTKRGTEVYPKFRICKSSDLMIRGGDFYAVWVEERGLWSTDEQDAIHLIDNEIRKAAKEQGNWAMLMEDAESGVIDSWHKYCQKQMRDSFHMLDEKLIFSNTPTNKKDYASKRLNYPLEEGKTEAYDKLMSTLYSPEEREKIEWAIGAIVCGASKKLQKFLVLYGAAGTGKSTVLNIIQQLFDGYYSVFDAKALGSSSNAFALEAFKSNPLVAIQHDGDLSRIEDNTRLNSLVSHELMTVNEKFKSTYANRFKCFLFMGTNKPVKITDAKSGLIRRLIDVSPTGNKLSQKEYRQATKQIEFELGAIAYHCQEVYLSNPNRYDDYIPVAMLGASNDFYNFVVDSYTVFKKEDGVTLKAAWAMYNTYCEEAKVGYPYSQRAFKEELKNYFRDYSERFNLGDGSRVRSYYSGFRTEKFEDRVLADIPEPASRLIEFKEQKSIFDEVCSGCLAQYATTKETPSKKWDNVTTTLKNIDTRKLHYVKVPENHIVIDFDIPDETGKKSFELNLQEASKWPATYAELSKSGKGIHLHYIYTGDPAKLSRIYDDHIEVKVFTGKSSLRRMLTKCNNHEIASISSGLPLKGDKSVINFEGVKSEKGLRTKIKRNLNKEYHSATKPSVDFIYKDLVDAYNSGMKYDVTDLRNDILAFASKSTHQADYCIKLVNKMPFKSEEPSDTVKNDDQPLVFYDVEVFPNLFLVNWKIEGPDRAVVRMINPEPSEIEELLKYRLVGFNCRRYDNHILYARFIGYTNEQLYTLSQRIINGSANCFFGEAYNISYTDVYDFSTEKKSLKKWEIELGIHHQELGLPWDQPVPEELWTKVAEYCDNDVIATEAVFNARKGDFVARQIQVDLVRLLHGIDNMSVNDTTNSLSGKIIFGKERKPQSVFNYRDLSLPVPYTEYGRYKDLFGADYVFHVFDKDGLPTYEVYDGKRVLPDGYSILPFFPRYIFDHGRSIWIDNDDLASIARGSKEKAFTLAMADKTGNSYQEIGEGGRVFARPNMYGNVWDGDISSQHPHSAIAEVLFGPVFTKRFEEIVEARVDIKHKDFESAGERLGGALKPYLTEELAAPLAQALKIVINSIYGLTSASFDNLFRDTRNKDNIVAKRGALFMTLLKGEVEKRGFTVAHIKTDSIKIPDATPDIQEFVIRFGKEFGYTFETEANFEKFCLVNNAVYIAKFKDGKHAGEWTATGAQFAVPYVFKKLFSKEEITFADMCETKSVTSALYLDMNENLPDVGGLEKEVAALLKKHSDKNGDLPFGIDEQVQALNADISKGHDYRFIGKVGQFCPIKPGCGGGVLLRMTEDKKTGLKKYAGATGTIGYRWMESEMVRTLEKEADIDRSYYDKMVDDAVDTISQFGDFEQFVSDDPYIPDDTPPWFGAEEPHGDEANLFAVR
nr:MAG TPA: DNA polymerase [Caudoviricetes sp.]